MSTPRQSGAGVWGPDGRFYAIGGVDAGQQVLDSVEAYSPKAKRWTAAPPMPTVRVNHMAAVSSGKIYVFGGYDGVRGTFVDTVTAYDPTTKTWTPECSSAMASCPSGSLAPMPTGRAAGAAAPGQDGRIYVLSGHTTESFGGQSPTVDVYDPTTNSWQRVAPVAVPRQSPAATVGHNGRIYLLGGTGTSAVEVYTPSDKGGGPLGVWVLERPMTTDRLGLGAATGSDGRIYAIGGHSNTAESSCSGNPSDFTLCSVEAFDPKNPTAGWSVVSRMTTRRQFMVAGASPDGRIYVAGGQDGINPAIKSAEASQT